MQTYLWLPATGVNSLCIKAYPFLHMGFKNRYSTPLSPHPPKNGGKMYQAQYYQAQSKCKSDIQDTFLCILLCIKPLFWAHTHTTREVYFSTIWEQPVAKFLKMLHLKKMWGVGLEGPKSEFTPTAYKTYGLKLCKMSASETLVELHKTSARNSLILQHEAPRR